MGCNCGRLQRENDELRQRVREYENGSDDFDEDEDEDEYEDVYEMSDRFDEPSEPAGGGYDSLDYDPRRSVGTMGGRLGDGHVARRARSAIRDQVGDLRRTAMDTRASSMAGRLTWPPGDRGRVAVGTGQAPGPPVGDSSIFYLFTKLSLRPGSGHGTETRRPRPDSVM